MKQSVRVIKTQSEYDAALARLSVLMDGEFDSDSALEAEMELLALVIESYEQKNFTPVLPDPIEAILFRMDQQGLSKKDLIPYFGSLSKVSEVLSRKRPLSLAMIRKIHAGLGISADVLINGLDELNADLGTEPNYDYLKFPLQEMKDRNYLDGFGFDFDLKNFKDYAEDFIEWFLRDVRDALQPALLRAPQHQNGSKLMDAYALLIWQAAVIKKARRQNLPHKYKEDVITKGWLKDLVALSRFDQGPLLAQQYLADSGISLVIEKHFKKTYLDGAAMLDGETPVVALTLRHDRLDNFWFALMHELIHVQKHLNQSTSFIPDNLDDKTKTSSEEIEADSCAREALISSEEWAKAKISKSPTVANVYELADRLRISPAIVAGRARYEKNNWRIFSGLLGGKGEVSKSFEAQLARFQELES